MDTTTFLQYYAAIIAEAAKSPLALVALALLVLQVVLLITPRVDTWKKTLLGLSVVAVIPIIMIAVQPPKGPQIRVEGGHYGTNADPSARNNATDLLRQTCNGLEVCDFIVNATNIRHTSTSTKNFIAEWKCTGSDEIHAIGIGPNYDNLGEAGWNRRVRLICLRR